MAAGRDEAGSEDQRALEENRRRALQATWGVGASVGLVAGVVVWLLTGWLVGLIVLVAVTIGVGLWIGHRAGTVVVRSLGARPLPSEAYPRLHNLVAGLCAVMGLPSPTLMVVDSPVPNAISAGRDSSSAVLVVTSALPDALNLVELEAVLAHELVHIKRHDGRPAGVAVALMSLVPIGPDAAARLVHRLAGPGREYHADRRAANVVRSPAALGAALRALIGAGQGRPPWSDNAPRAAALTRWLWIDPPGLTAGRPIPVGELDAAPVRADVLALF